MMTKMGLARCTQCVLKEGCWLTKLSDEFPNLAWQALSHQHFKPGETVLFEDALNQSLKIIQTGLVLLGKCGTKNQTNPLAVLGQGSILGARALSQEPEFFWAKAVSDVTVCEVGVALLPNSGEKTMQSLMSDVCGKTVSSISEWRRVVGVRALRPRVLAALSLLIREHGGSMRILMPPQADLAKLLCISRESLSKALRSLEAEGIYARISRRLIEVDGSKFPGNKVNLRS